MNWFEQNSLKANPEKFQSMLISSTPTLNSTQNVLVVVILFPEEYNITHSICTTFKKSFHKCIPLAVAREAEAHRADNRYFNNDTAGGKQGARGDILLFPDVSSTLHYQNEWFNINGSDIYL